ENKRKFDDTSRNNQNQQQQNKKQNTSRAYTARSGEKKPYRGSKPLCSKCNYHHDDQCAPKCHKCNSVGHLARDCKSPANANTANNQRGTRVGPKATCFECGAQGHFKRECPKSFVSTAFSSQIDITPTTLDHYYDVELADGRIIRLNTIIRRLPCCHRLCLENRSYSLGNETLIVRGDGSDQGNETRLNIISCTKMQKYMLKGCHVFLAHVTTKKTEDKSEGKRLEDVLIIQAFPEVFTKDLPGLPPTQQVEFQIDLIPGDAPVARVPHRLALSEMKELSDQLQELSDKGFIRPSSSP
ncbi:putative reverse transcriptase domain-containing protein, partial [Tanacetum coccineum]